MSELLSEYQSDVFQIKKEVEINVNPFCMCNINLPYIIFNMHRIDLSIADVDIFSSSCINDVTFLNFSA